MSEAHDTASAGGPPAREDTLLDGRVRLLQPVDGYRVALDPVLMAAAVPARPHERVLDLGCGVGAASLCLLARQPAARCVGLELQAEMAALAECNARLNGLAGRFEVVCGDLLRPPLNMRPSGFHHVMANPPHLPADSARVPGSAGRAAANVEGEAKLADWVRVALALLRSRGTLTMVHRADRLHELLAALSSRAGEIAVLPLWPGPGKDAKRVIVRARKGVATPTRLLPGLTLHTADGGFTAEADAILRGAAALEV